MITMLIATDARIYRDGLAGALCAHPSIEVVGTASNAKEALQQAAGTRPDVLLVDTAMKGSLEVAQLVRRGDSDARVVALAISDEDKEIIAWAEAGAAGFVTRESSLDDLVCTVMATARGELVCSPRLAAILLRHIASITSNRTPTSNGTVLTPRQAYVLELVERGMSNKEIARVLGIELATVKNHVHRLLGKLKVKRRGDAAALAYRFMDPRRSREARLAPPQ